MSLRLKALMGGFAAALCTAPALAQGQGVVMVRDVSLAMAMAIAQTGLEFCQQKNFRIGISVVDRGGHVLVTLRDERAAHHTVELSVRKAYTSRIFRQTSKEFSQRMRDNPLSSGLRDTAGVMASIGGIPIKVGEETIGGIGVSGAPGGENDEACALAGLAKVADQLK